MKNPLEIDIHRTYFIHPFLQHWMEPTSRFVFEREENLIDIYLFPDPDDEKTFHFVSCGAAYGYRNGKRCHHEIYATIIYEEIEKIDEQVAYALMNIIEYGYRSDVNFIAHKTIPPIKSLSDMWEVTAVLIDHPILSDLMVIQSYGQSIDVYQIFFIYESEYNFIHSTSLIDFYTKVTDHGGMSTLLNPNRKPII